MKHSIEIRSRGRHVWRRTDTDKYELALSASSYLLGKDMSHIRVLVDGDYYHLPSMDVSKVQAGMEMTMYNNGKPVDFELDGLFEV